MPQTPFIFICYRREDSSGHAYRLYDHLSTHFGQDQIFMDIDVLQPGQDFVEVIEGAVGSCGVMIVIIGRQWLNSPDAEGRRKIDNPEDWVRLEIVSALDRNIRVIPVLVHGATMPRSTDLPAPLTKLTRLHALDLNYERYWKREIEGLIELLEDLRSRLPAAPPPPVEDPSKDLFIITSPIVGTFYRAPSPNAEPYVKIGSSVRPETVVCIVEAMKLMNEIVAEVTGTVEKIYVENTAPVEYGQRLFGIKMPPEKPPDVLPDESAANAETTPSDEATNYHIITSPIVGTFYNAPSPNAEHFVRVGSSVRPETVVCIVEAMKLMNEIVAEVTGTVEKIYIENGAPVEFGQKLYGIRIPPPPKPPAPPDSQIITAPFNGTFYRAHGLTVPPLVEVGSSVEPETVVCIIEAMDLMNEIWAEVTGTVEEIYAENNSPVEYGQPLFKIKLTPPEPEKPHTITSPTVGIFHRSSPFNAAPYVKVGSSIKPETIVGVIEVMQQMMEIQAGTTGVVEKIYVQQGELVEYGQPLFEIKK